MSKVLFAANDVNAISSINVASHVPLDAEAVAVMSTINSVN